MKKIIALNWKMNPVSFKEALELFKTARNYAECVAPACRQAGKNAEIIIFPPFLYLSELSSVISRQSLVKLGAQDLFWETSGAYTGEVSPKMLKNMGVKYVIVGHSERRKYMNETDKIINKKVLAALKAGLKVILCVGEGARGKTQKNAAKKFVKNQLQNDLKGIKNFKLEIKNLVIAYEPVWAIGTGKNCNPSDAAEMAEFINHEVKKLMKLKANEVVSVLYGGSVTGSNINQFLDKKEINGVLVGGASVDKKEVNKILKEL